MSFPKKMNTFNHIVIAPIGLSGKKQKCWITGSPVRHSVYLMNGAQCYNFIHCSFAYLALLPGVHCTVSMNN